VSGAGGKEARQIRDPHPEFGLFSSLNDQGVV
jgi:hypothetical protein